MKRFLGLLVRIYCVVCAFLVPLMVAGGFWLIHQYAWESGSSVRDKMLAEDIGLYLLEEGPEARGKRFERMVSKLKIAGELQPIEESELSLMCGIPDEFTIFSPDAKSLTYNYSRTAGHDGYVTFVITKGELESIGFNVRQKSQ